MRIIGGRHRGKKLKSFDGEDIRPTSDRAREALFNIIASHIPDADFLDLCSGTGAVGLEALSRGAKSVTFVDSDKKSLALTEYNLKSIKENAKLVHAAAENFIASATDKFDVVFFDPPYSFGGISGILKNVKMRKVLNKGGLFIYEHRADRQSVEEEGFTLKDSRKYGVAVFDFYEERL